MCVNKFFFWFIVFIRVDDYGRIVIKKFSFNLILFIFFLEFFCLNFFFFGMFMNSNYIRLNSNLVISDI